MAPWGWRTCRRARTRAPTCVVFWSSPRCQSTRLFTSLLKVSMSWREKGKVIRVLKMHLATAGVKSVQVFLMQIPKWGFSAVTFGSIWYELLLFLFAATKILLKKQYRESKLISILPLLEDNKTTAHLLEVYMFAYQQLETSVLKASCQVDGVLGNLSLCSSVCDCVLFSLDRAEDGNGAAAEVCSFAFMWVCLWFN